jgi:FkbH-like protein
LDDFVSVQIGWEPKAEAIARILEEFGLTPKSVVFVDDNPVERASVKAAFPEIRAIGANPFQIRRILVDAPETQVRLPTKETLAREAMVRRQKVREANRKALSRDDFLAGVNCHVKLKRIRDSRHSDHPRVFELLNKTKQFNTNGKRWAPMEVDTFFNDGGFVIAFTVEDKYTAYGLVGVLLVKGSNIVQFVMSCRVLGLDVEIGVLRHVMRALKAEGVAEQKCDTCTVTVMPASMASVQPHARCRPRPWRERRATRFGERAFQKDAMSAAFGGHLSWPDFLDGRTAIIKALSKVL